MRHLVYENECVCACECVGVCVPMGEGRVLIPHSLCSLRTPHRILLAGTNSSPRKNLLPSSSGHFSGL